MTKFYGKTHKKLEVKLINIFPLLKLRFVRWLQLHSLYIAIMSIRHIKQFKPDIIYSRLTLLEMLFLPKNIPIYYEMHSLGIQGKRGIYDAIFRGLLRYKNFKQIIVTTKELKNILGSKYRNIKIVNAPLSAEEPIDIEIDELEIIKDIVIYEMENAIQLDVPIKVDSSYGKSWYEAH